MESFNHLAPALARLAQAYHPTLWDELKGIIHNWEIKKYNEVPFWGRNVSPTPDAAALKWLHDPYGMGNDEYRAWQIFDELQDFLLDATYRREILVTVARELDAAVELVPGLLQAKFNNGWRVFPFDFWQNRVNVSTEWYPVIAVAWSPAAAGAADSVEPERTESSADMGPTQWLLSRAEQDKRRLKISDRSIRKKCMAETGATWRQYDAAFQALPAHYRYERGKPKLSKLSRSSA